MQSFVQTGNLPITDHIADEISCLASAVEEGKNRSNTLAMGDVHAYGKTDVDTSCSNRCASSAKDPVCGSDGKTYENLCTLRFKNCHNSVENQITVKYRSRCMTSEDCIKPCDEWGTPVCGTDGKTYASECVLENSNCYRIHQTPVQVEYLGKCKCDLACTKEQEPVCASDGGTYTNICEMEVVSCLKPDLNIRLNHTGRCKNNCQNMECETLRIQVCGSDGKTYANSCALKMSNCGKIAATQVSFVRNGACE
ncbi:four-domain proteases inhibitor-like [Physella acuta]|uniref:four-domain proteases inhibitor-like n=1 Tax=Physella acuta TaxID=109671 RepID=UPI0027DB0BB8|nr:four-domain proteases inhibitor-like [Physella acuta]